MAKAGIAGRTITDRSTHKLAGMLVDMYGCDPEKIVLSYVGPVIGSHSGPGTVALFFPGIEK